MNYYIKVVFSKVVHLDPQYLYDFLKNYCSNSVPHTAWFDLFKGLYFNISRY